MHGQPGPCHGSSMVEYPALFTLIYATCGAYVAAMILSVRLNTSTKNAKNNVHHANSNGADDAKKTNEDTKYRNYESGQSLFYVGACT